MIAITLEDLSAEEAEIVLAQIWRVLEANGLDTPGLSLKSPSTPDHRGLILTLSFVSPDAAGLVAQTLHNATSVGQVLPAY